MPINNRIADLQVEMAEWRRDLHANPEIGFDLPRTAGVVAEKLRSWGIEVHEGIAKTGLVGVLHGNGSSGRSLGIRADMDALPMQEEGDVAYRSTIDGRMHACGHDGHTTMLLGAAKYLAETRNFDGTVHFIFQPAEEGGGGGRVMVEEGLFDRFKCDTVWAFHNAPHMPAGTIAVRTGPALAAADTFRITITGRGSHAARPNAGIDPVAIGVQIYTAMQTIVSRNVDPVESAVVSVTQFHAGSANNVIAGSAWLAGTVRSFSPAVRDQIEGRVQEIVAGAQTMYGCGVALDYRRGYPSLFNPEAEAKTAVAIARDVVGEGNVNTNPAPAMGAEDFSYMLNERPGSFVWLGGGVPGKDFGLHHPKYDFNDDMLPVGASYWSKLVETLMPRA